MRASDPALDLVALGEPMAEFAAETPGRLGEVRTFRRGYGGDTSNVVVAAARMGARGGYVTRVGDDEFGRAFLALWQAEGIDTRQVIVERGSRTGVYFIARHARGHDFTYYRRDSAASHLSPADLDRAALAAARVLHTSGITQAVSPSARQAAETAMRIVRAAGGAVSYDVNYRPALWPPQTARPAVEAACAQATMVFLSEEDAAALYAGVAPEDAAARLLGLGPQLVVLKRGARGCLILAAAGERHDLPGWPVEAVDTTGAGDAFAGAFVTAWLEGARLDDAGRLANAVGALTATGLGAVESIPRRPQVMAFLREQQARTQHRRE